VVTPYVLALSSKPPPLTGGMNTKVVFTRNRPLSTVLINEATGQELYKIETPRLIYVRTATRVYRCYPPTSSVPNHLDSETDEPHGDRSSGEDELLGGERPDRPEEENGDEGGSVVDGAEGAAVGEDSPLVDNEIARLYWKWFKSPRIVFEGKIRTRAEYMPRGKMRA
jgi:hypothetical protein